jgi:sec-independent protein translocase protein TatA
MHSIGEVLIIVLAIFLIFGIQRLPKIGRSLGESLKEFKKGMREGAQDESVKKDELSGKGDKI